MKVRTAKYMNSFFPSTIKSWNVIVRDIQPCLSISKFKQNLLALIRPVPRSTFDIRDFSGLKSIYQLRVGLSQLKCHKRRHKFPDTPSDWCDCHCAPEDTHHFLLKCSLYTNARLKLISSVSSILTVDLRHLLDDPHLYLYGHSSLTKPANTSIVLSTIQYINETDRFS